MKIILDNIFYKGKRFDHYEVEMPDVKDLSDISEGEIVEYVKGCLEISVKHYKDQG